jgi:DNA-binding HxlR family transcriptional regulator
MITRERDPDDGKRVVYRPTAKASDTLPIMLEMVLWSGRHDPETPVSAAYLRRIREERDRVMAEILGRADQAPPESKSAPER